MFATVRASAPASSAARFLGGPGDKPNVRNQRRELDPKGSLGGFSGGPDHLGYQSGVAPELHTSLLDVGAGNIEFVASKALGTLQDPDHFDVVLNGATEDVGYDRRIEFLQYREFFGYEGPDPHILEADGIEHAGGGREEPGSGGTFDGFPGKALCNEAAEAVQVNEVGEFEAVTKGSTGGENRITQAQRANFYAEVNGTCGTHFVERITRSRYHPRKI